MSPRLLSLILLPMLLSGCYLQPPQMAPASVPAAVVPVASPVVIAPPAVKATEAAQAIQKEAKDTELRVKDITIGVYQKIVDATRQLKITQASFTKAQKLFDAVQSQMHAYTVLGPLGEKPGEDARIGVAKALEEFLAYAQQLKIL